MKNDHMILVSFGGHSYDKESRKSHEKKSSLLPTLERKIKLSYKSQNMYLR